MDVPWLVFLAYWAVSALKTRATVRREPFAARYGVMFLEVIGFTLLLSPGADIGLLGHHFEPRTMSVAIVGTAFTWVGISLAVWARHHLGQFWSGRISLKEGHQLIRTGPYARLRHPIYTGLDLAAIGSALVHRPLEMCIRSGCHHGRLLDQGQEGRGAAGGPIRRGLRRTPQARRISPSTAKVKFSRSKLFYSVCGRYTGKSNGVDRLAMTVAYFSAATRAPRRDL
jgi:protein-S-isoprenylcysteine O-methyltransferase Ste14